MLRNSTDDAQAWFETSDRIDDRPAGESNEKSMESSGPDGTRRLGLIFV
jgi:hypothetical protein